MDKDDYDYDYSLRGLLFILLEYVNGNALPFDEVQIQAAYVIKKIEQIINKKDLKFDYPIRTAIKNSYQ